MLVLFGSFEKKIKSGWLIMLRKNFQFPIEHSNPQVDIVNHARITKL